MGFTQISERSGGRHEVGLVSVAPEYRRQGLARAMYDAIEGDLGARMQPSGHLFPDGYAMWKARDPEAVQYHREVDGDYLSPRKLMETAEDLGPEEGADYREAFDALPPEAKTPEALATMFQRRGDKDLGSITLRPARARLLRLMADADASTFVHEMGHDWLEQMMRDAAHPAAPEAFRADAQAVRSWLGNDGGALTVDQQEKFARSFEQYVRAGEAPAPELAGVFAQLKDWLTRIYRTITSLGAPISDDIRGVFDRLLTAEPDRPAPQVPARPDVAALAQRQQAIYRSGFAPGMPQAEFDALNESVYGAKAPARDGAATASRSGCRRSRRRAPTVPRPSAAQRGPKTAADALLATWQQRFDAAGVVPTAEERASSTRPAPGSRRPTCRPRAMRRPAPASQRRGSEMRLNMDAFADCVGKIAERGGVDQDGAKDILQEVANRAEALRATGEADPFVKAADEAATRLRDAAKLDAADALRNASIRQGVMRNIEANGGLKGAVQTLRDLLHGSNVGSRDNIQSQWKGLAAGWQAVLSHKLHTAGVERAAISGELDGELAEALWRAHGGTPSAGVKVSSAAQAMADAVKPLQDIARDRLNTAGARIGDALDYVAHTDHDPQEDARRGGPAHVGRRRLQGVVASGTAALGRADL